MFSNPIPEGRRMAFVSDPEAGGFRFIGSRNLFRNVPPQRVAAVATAVGSLFSLAVAAGANSASDYIRRLSGSSGEAAQIEAVRSIDQLERTGASNDPGLQQLLSVRGSGSLISDVSRGTVDELKRIQPGMAESVMTPSGQPETRGQRRVVPQTIQEVVRRSAEQEREMASNPMSVLNTLAPGADPSILGVLAPESEPSSIGTSFFTESEPSSTQSSFTRSTGSEVPLGIPIGAPPMAVDASTDPAKSAATQILALAAQEKDEKKRKELIETINAANQLDFTRKIEQTYDPVLSAIQQQRIDIAKRPVANYSQTVRRSQGLQPISRFGEY